MPAFDYSYLCSRRVELSELYQPPSRYIKIVIELMKIRDVKNRSENYLLDIVGMGSMNSFDWYNCHNFPMKPTAVAVV